MIQGSEGVGPKTISSFGWGGVVPQHPCFHEEKRQKPPLLQCGDECRSQCIPAFIVALVLGVPAVMAGGPAATVGTIGIGLLVMIIVGILVTLISGLRERGLKRGVAAICIGGGEGLAVCVEIV